MALQQSPTIESIKASGLTMHPTFARPYNSSSFSVIKVSTRNYDNEMPSHEKDSYILLSWYVTLL
jgi:hypothetical protein